MLTLWYYRIIGTLTAGACDIMSLFGLVTAMASTITPRYYDINLVPFPSHRGGVFGLISYWIKRGRPRG